MRAQTGDRNKLSPTDEDGAFRFIMGQDGGLPAIKRGGKGQTGLWWDKGDKAKGPGEGTRYLTQKRDDEGHWTEGVGNAKPEKPSAMSKPGGLDAGELKDFYDTVNEDMPAEVADAFADYIGGSPASQKLRSGEALGKLQKMVDGLDAGMAPLPGYVEVYRGMDTPWEELFGSKPEIGGIIEDAGYMSTATNKSVAEQFGSEGVLLEIDVPPGTLAMSMQSVPLGSDFESELLLARGQSLEITGIRQVYMGWDDRTDGYKPDPAQNDPEGFFVDVVKARVLP